MKIISSNEAIIQSLNEFRTSVGGGRLSSIVEMQTSPYANRESPPMKQKHVASCFTNRHEIQQLATPCRYHTPNKPSNDLTILASHDSDHLDLPRAGIKIDTNFLYTETAKRIVREGIVV